MQRAFFAGVSAIVLLLIGACGPAVQSAGVSAVAGPPQRPCVFPNSEELALIASESDVVAVGSVDSGQVVHYAGINSAYTRNTFHIQSVLRGTFAGKVLTIEEISGVPVHLMQPGRYVVFLVKTDRTDGLISYFLADGLYGAFPLRAKGVVRECPTFPPTVQLAEASGSGMALTEFTNEIRNLPTIPRPHK